LTVNLRNRFKAGKEITYLDYLTTSGFTAGHKELSFCCIIEFEDVFMSELHLSFVFVQFGVQSDTSKLELSNKQLIGMK